MSNNSLNTTNEIVDTNRALEFKSQQYKRGACTTLSILSRGEREIERERERKEKGERRKEKTREEGVRW